jgi:hypothetical protein
MKDILKHVFHLDSDLVDMGIGTPSFSKINKIPFKKFQEK